MREEYANRHFGNEPQVRWNDLAFAIHVSGNTALKYGGIPSLIPCFLVGPRAFVLRPRPVARLRPRRPTAFQYLYAPLHRCGHLGHHHGDNFRRHWGPLGGLLEVQLARRRLSPFLYQAVHLLLKIRASGEQIAPFFFT